VDNRGFHTLSSPWSVLLGKKAGEESSTRVIPVAVHRASILQSLNSQRESARPNSRCHVVLQPPQRVTVNPEIGNCIQES
jgi:hypothetical protein